MLFANYASANHSPYSSANHRSLGPGGGLAQPSVLPSGGRHGNSQASLRPGGGLCSSGSVSRQASFGGRPSAVLKPASQEAAPLGGRPSQWLQPVQREVLQSTSREAPHPGLSAVGLGTPLLQVQARPPSRMQSIENRESLLRRREEDVTVREWHVRRREELLKAEQERGDARDEARHRYMLSQDDIEQVYAERVSALAAKEKELQEKKKCLEDDQACCAVLMAKVRDQEVMNIGHATELRARDEEASAREKAVASRENGQVQRDEELSVREAQLDASEDELGRRLQAVTDRENAVAAREERIAALEREREALAEEQLRDFEAKRLDHRRTIEEEELRLQRRELDVAAKEAKAMRREQALDDRLSFTVRKEASVRALKDSVELERQVVEGMQQRLKSDQAALATDTEALQAQRLAMEAQLTPLPSTAEPQALIENDSSKTVENKSTPKLIVRNPPSKVELPVDVAPACGAQEIPRRAFGDMTNWSTAIRSGVIVVR